MTNLLGAYKIKATPDLPQTEITQSLNFVVPYSGGYIPFTSIRIDSTGIYYLPQAEEGAETEPTYELIYIAEEGAWLASELRSFLVEKEQSASDEFDLWLTSNLWVKPELTEAIEFTVNGEAFKAAKGVSWYLWLNSTLKSDNFEVTQDELVAYMNCIISHGEQDVNIYDFIIAGAKYEIKPQVNVCIQMSDDVETNLLFAKRGISGYVLYPNQTYKVALKCDDNYHVIPQSATYLNDYVKYELLVDKFIITVGNIPNDFIGQDPLKINIVFARKIYDKLTEITAFEAEKGKIVELAPQYRVNINGPYYLENKGSISKEIIGCESNTVYGFSMPSVMLEQYAPSDTAMPAATFLGIAGIDPSQIILSSQNYVMGEWLTEYINQELLLEDVIGQPIMILDYDVDKITDYYIAQWAQDANLSVTDYIAQLETEAGASEGSAEYEAYVISKIESKDGDIEQIRYVTSTTVNEEILAIIDTILKTYKTNLYEASRSYQGTPMKSLIFYAIGANNTVIKNDFSYTARNGLLYPLYCLKDGEKIPITTDFIVSDENAFDLYATEEKLNGIQLAIAENGYVPPVDRYTPGTLSVVTKCLAGDTLIEMADGSLKRIDQIQIGDEVKTISGSEKVIYSDSSMHKQKNQYTDYYFNDGTMLRVIKNHRVYNPKHRKFVHITTLKIGDEIVKNGGIKATLIDKKTVIGESIAHYTIFTENLNGYFANGILCGNIFSNIKIGWMRKLLLKLYSKFVLCKELQRYG